MLEIHKNYIFDKDNQPIAVQIPFSEFEQIEEILENFGLIQLMLETEDNELLSKEDALKYYQSLSVNDHCLSRLKVSKTCQASLEKFSLIQTTLRIFLFSKTSSFLFVSMAL